MSEIFVTNDPVLRSYKFLIPGMKGRIEFEDGLLDPEKYGPNADKVRAFLMERTTYPFVGAHYHLKDRGDVKASDLPPPTTVHQGAVGSRTMGRSTRGR